MFSLLSIISTRFLSFDRLNTAPRIVPLASFRRSKERKRIRLVDGADEAKLALAISGAGASQLVVGARAGGACHARRLVIGAHLNTPVVYV